MGLRWCVDPLFLMRFPEQHAVPGLCFYIKHEAAHRTLECVYRMYIVVACRWPMGGMAAFALFLI